MADNIVLNPGALGSTIATDDDGTAHHQYVKVEFGGDGTFTKVAAASPLPVNWAGTAPPIGAGLEATALRVTVATDSTGVVSVDDNGSTLSIDDGAGAITVDGTITANAGTNLNTSLLALEAGGNLAGAATSLAVVDDWDESDRAKVNLIVGQAGIAAGAGAVGVTVPRVTHASDDPVTTAIQIMDDWDNGASDGASVSGDVAHDTADAGEPVKIGAKAVTTILGNTLVAANDRSNLFSDLDGALVTRDGGCLGDILNERVSNTDGASTASTVFGATASQRNYITDIIVHNAHATTNGYVDIRDGTAGTILATIPAPALGGAVVNFRTPLRFTANTAVAFDVSAAITTIYITFCGYKSKA